MNDDTHSLDDDIPPSKTRRKREVEGAQNLGKSLLTLRPRQLEALDLPGELLAALREYKRLPNSNEAKRRQLQFIGRVMRSLDHQAIGDALERLQKPDPAETRRGRCIEQWAECLLSGGDGGDGKEADRVGEFLESHPAAERQTMRQLLRNCRQDNPKARRRLLDYLNAHIGADSPAPI